MPQPENPDYPEVSIGISENAGPQGPPGIDGPAGPQFL